jgi:excisionase family DNA binding protein
MTQKAARFHSPGEKSGLSVAYGTIRNAILAGKLTAYKIMGTYRIRPEDLDAFVESCRVEPGRRASQPPASKSKAGGSAFTNLDGARLLDAWRRRGVRSARRGGRNVPSSGSSCGPSTD